MYQFDNIHVLVVEDNQYMTQLVRTLLTAIGMRNVQTARSGDAALEMLQDGAYDLIIADLAMEPVNGLEMTKMIRNSDNPLLTMIPIIMMTGHSERHMVEAARDAGVSEFLCKPLTAQNLYKRLVSVVEQPRNFIKASQYFGPDRRRKTTNEYEGVERRCQAPLAKTG